MKLIDHLDDESKNKLIKMRKRKHRKKKRRKNMSNNITMSKNTSNKDHLTERDIKELMGMNRDRYERRRGAVRRK